MRGLQRVISVFKKECVGIEIDSIELRIDENTKSGLNPKYLNRKRWQPIFHNRTLIPKLQSNTQRAALISITGFYVDYCS